MFHLRKKFQPSKKYGIVKKVDNLKTDNKLHRAQVRIRVKHRVIAEKLHLAVQNTGKGRLHKIP